MLKNVLSSVFGSRSESHSSQPQASASEPITIVTSFHGPGFAEYGSAFLESFERHWPGNYKLLIYAEEFSLDPPSTRVQVIDLHKAVPALLDFKRKHATRPIASGRIGDNYNYRFDARRFANKSFAICDAARRADTRLMVWLDGDTRTFLDVPGDFLSQTLSRGDFLAYLGRMGNHTETGFLPFDLSHPAAKDFFAMFEAMYTTDTIFTLREWHDCEAIDTCRGALTAQGRLQARNLNVFGVMHPFVNSIAGLFMDHMKGPTRKTAKQSHAEDYVIPPASRVNFYGGRYSQIPALLRQMLPSEIIEVGTWSGWRAVQMATISLSQGRPVHYKGYDVFETFTTEFDTKEMNVKPHFSHKEVSRLLSLVAEIYPRFTFELIQGDTNTTLRDEAAEFVFLDGGHSVETIRSDFAAVRGSDVILLDDYYAGGIDTTAFGCNLVLESIEHQVLPIKDPVAGGGTTQFALVSRHG